MPVHNVNTSQAVVLRLGGAAGTAHHQTRTGLLWAPPVTETRFASGSALADVWEGATLHKLEIQNRSGSAANVGMGFRLANRIWIAGRLSSDGATFTDLTSSLQSQTAATLQVTGADQTGFVFGCRIPFDAVSLNLTTAETDDGGATVPDHAVQYSDLAGSGWTTVTSAMTFTNNFTLTDTVLTAAVKDFVWQHPNSWGPWTSTVLPTGYYYLRVTSAHREANDVAAIATGAELYSGLWMEALADGEIYADDAASFWCEYATGLVGYASVADAGNTFKAFVTT